VRAEAHHYFPRLPPPRLSSISRCQIQGIAISADSRYSHLMSTLAQRIDLRLSQMPVSQSERLERLFWGLLEIVETELSPAQDAGLRARGQAALDRIAARGGMTGIKDPSAWQREQRADRPLPGREP
jgi:hypothetical protein